jgi:hypothetical protein
MHEDCPRLASAHVPARCCAALPACDPPHNTCSSLPIPVSNIFGAGAQRPSEGLPRRSLAGLSTYLHRNLHRNLNAHAIT